MMYDILIFSPYSQTNDVNGCQRFCDFDRKSAFPDDTTSILVSLEKERLMATEVLHATGLFITRSSAGAYNIDLQRQSTFYYATLMLVFFKRLLFLV